MAGPSIAVLFNSHAVANTAHRSSAAAFMLQLSSRGLRGILLQPRSYVVTLHPVVADGPFSLLNPVGKWFDLLYFCDAPSVFFLQSPDDHLFSFWQFIFSGCATGPSRCSLIPKGLALAVELQMAAVSAEVCSAKWGAQELVAGGQPPQPGLPAPPAPCLENLTQTVSPG